MKRNEYLSLLRSVSEEGEISVSSLSKLLKKRHGDHRDYYPLVSLIESEHLGISFNHNPAEGAEKKREYSLSHSLYMLSLERKNGEPVEYNGIVSTGSLSADNEKVFLKSKGALFLAELAEKRRDRLVYFLLGLISGITALVIKDGMNGIWNSFTACCLKLGENV